MPSDGLSAQPGGERGVQDFAFAVYSCVRLLLGDGSAGFGRRQPGGPYRIAGPAGLAYDPWRDRLLVVTIHNHCVLAVDLRSGEIRVLIGCGEPGPADPVCEVASCRLRGPEAVSVDAAGRIFVADTGNQVVRAYDPDSGLVSIVAGTGAPGCGENRPATEAPLHEPCGVAARPDGGLYVVDHRNHRVCLVKQDGMLTRVAGSGREGYGGDQGPADEALLAGPHGMALGGHGNIFIADTHNCRVRKVDPRTGCVSTVAGCGLPGYSGDGGPATSAMVSGPGHSPEGVHAICAATDGTLFIADTGNNRIRAVDPGSGLIRTVAGSGERGDPAAEETPTEAKIGGPHGLVTDGRGNVYFNEYQSHVVRVLVRQEPAARAVAES